jgi:twitching motility protein PilT
MEEMLRQYRLRNQAVQLRQFTSADLAAAARCSLALAQKFVNQLEKTGSDVLTKKNLPSGRAGRPMVLYSLGVRGVRELAKEIAPIAAELNAYKVTAAEPVSAPVFEEKRERPPRWQPAPGWPDWFAVFANDLSEAVKIGVGDVLIEAGQPAMLRSEKDLKPLRGGEVWSPTRVEEAVQSALSPRQAELLESRGWTAGAPVTFENAVWGMRVKRVGRRPAVELKRMPSTVPTIEDLYLPPLVGDMAEQRTGLVLITGSSRSGRSRTMAAFVNQVNRTRPDRIITLEEPILYLHRRHQSIVEQRQIAVDVPDFASGVEQAVQDTADVLTVSDFTDREAVATALAAAEHSLVVGRVSSRSPGEAIEKLVSLFPPNEREEIRSAVVGNLRGMVALTGMEPPSGREPVAAASAIFVDKELQESFLENSSVESINSLFEVDTSSTQSLRTSVAKLYERHKITTSVAEKYDVRAARAVNAGGIILEDKHAAKG